MTQADPELAALRLLTYNIQAGGAVERYRHYVTRSWQHILPHSGKAENLEAVARVAAGFDIVGLQEVDDGSLRTGFVNQTQFLAERAGFPFWSHQANRDVAKLARSCNSLLSRLRPSRVLDHKLPGRIAGRGALMAHYGDGDDALVVMIVHLSLGRRSRLMQLDFLSELIAPHPNTVLMGDLNTAATSPEMERFLSTTHLRVPYDRIETFPSWKPQRAIDHILVGDQLSVRNAAIIDVPFSDHLPLAMEIHAPPEAVSRGG